MQNPINIIGLLVLIAAQVHILMQVYYKIDIWTTGALAVFFVYNHIIYVKVEGLYLIIRDFWQSLAGKEDE